MPSKASVAGEFRSNLKAGREAQGLRQADLAAVCERSSAWYTRVEVGGAPPPDRETCDLLEQALNLPTNTLWSKAAPERLATLHPDLFAWHLEQVEHPTPFRTLADFTLDELLAELRRRAS